MLEDRIGSDLVVQNCESNCSFFPPGFFVRIALLFLPKAKLRSSLVLFGTVVTPAFVWMISKSRRPLSRIIPMRVLQSIQ